MNLATKYRPASWVDVLGQGTTVEVLQHILRTGSYPSAVLLTGMHGSGKTSIARLFAKGVLCESSENKPCGQCSSCREFSPDSAPNYCEIDAASAGLVEDVRLLVEESNYRSFGGVGKRVVLIDECHMLSRSAQNALLKLFEEGSAHTHYILCTTDIGKLLPTVVARCLTFRMTEIPEESTLEKLRQVCEVENIAVDEDALTILVSSKKSHIRDSYMLLDQLRYYPKVTLGLVKTFLGLDLYGEYYALLRDLLEDGDAFLDRLLKLQTQALPADIHEGLSQACLRVFKISRGMRSAEPDPEMLEICASLGSSLGQRVLRVLEYLGTRHPTTMASLECSLLCLQGCLLNGFPGETKADIPNKTSQKVFSSELDRLKSIGYKKNTEKKPEPVSDKLEVPLTKLSEIQSILGGKVVK